MPFDSIIYEEKAFLSFESEDNSERVNLQGKRFASKRKPSKTFFLFFFISQKSFSSDFSSFFVRDKFIKSFLVSSYYAHCELFMFFCASSEKNLFLFCFAFASSRGFSFLFHLQYEKAKLEKFIFSICHILSTSNNVINNRSLFIKTAQLWCSQSCFTILHFFYLDNKPSSDKLMQLKFMTLSCFVQFKMIK